MIISDHLPSFLIIPIETTQLRPTNKIEYKRDTQKLSEDDCILDYLNVDWDSELQLEKNDVNFSTERFFTKMTEIIDKDLPFRTLSAKESKQMLKTWIKPVILAEIDTYNLYEKLIKTKGIEIQSQFNRIRNEITSLTRKNKEKYYKNYFENHNKNLTKIWSCIKETIIKQKSSTLPSSLVNKDTTLTNPKEIADNFNYYFSKIAESILKIRQHESNHSYKDYLKNSMPNSHIFCHCEQGEV